MLHFHAPHDGIREDWDNYPDKAALDNKDIYQIGRFRKVVSPNLKTELSFYHFPYLNPDDFGIY